jgi:hypothetical protein
LKVIDETRRSLVLLVLICLLLVFWAPAGASAAKPFGPTEVMMMGFPDWNDLSVASHVHATLVGSAHQDGTYTGDLLKNPSSALARFSAAHAAGMRVVARICPDGNDASFRYASAVDIDGNYIESPAPPAGRPWQSIHHPDWRDHLVSYAKAAVDCGADIICIDGWTNNYAVLEEGLNGDFSTYSLQDFRDYLSRTYSTAQLAAAGIPDIATFDYRLFIRDKYLGLYQTDRDRVPFFQDFKLFQLVSSKGYWTDIINRTKQYGLDTYGKKILFTVNLPEFDARTHQGIVTDLPICDTVDAVMAEYRFSGFPATKTAPVFKLFESFGQQIALHPNAGFSAELYGSPDYLDLASLYSADAYASGGFTYAPSYDPYIAGGVWAYFDPDISRLYPFYDFLYKKQSLYTGTSSLARIGVVYSYPTALRGNLGNENFFGMNDLLIRAHRQYGDLFLADGSLMTDSMSLAKLRHYRLLVMPGIKYLSDRHVSLLLSYVRKGGRILAFGETGTSDEKGAAKGRRTLRRLMASGMHTYGSGRVYYMAANVGSAFLNRPSSTIKASMVRAIDRLCDDPISTDATQNVGLTAYWNSALKADVVHLVNYSYDTVGHTFNPSGPIRLKIKIPKSRHIRQLAAYCYSPEWTGPRAVKMVTIAQRNKAVIYVGVYAPGLKTYSVVLIGERSRIGALPQ